MIRMSYILAADGKTPILPATFTDLAAWWSNAYAHPEASGWDVGDGRLVDQDGAHVRVSTKFLGIDLRFHFAGPPVLWETMIFGGRNDQFQRRYSTWAAASAGHELALEIARGEREP